MYYSRAQLPIGASWVWTISRYKQRQPGCRARRHSWVNETEGSTLLLPPLTHPPTPPSLPPYIHPYTPRPPISTWENGFETRAAPQPSPPNEQMEASATIITTLPGSLLTNKNNTGAANKPQSNMTPPLMSLTALSLQGRASHTDSFSSKCPATAAFSSGWGETVKVISFIAPLMLESSLSFPLICSHYGFPHFLSYMYVCCYSGGCSH